MLTDRKTLFAAMILSTFLWTFPAYGLVIDGPSLNLPEKGWRNFGLIIRAEADVMLVSVRFPNQGSADIIELRRDSDSALLASVPVPAGNRDAIVNLNYPLSAQEIYRLVATTPNNRYFGSLGAYNFPAGNPEISILSSYLGSPYYSLWFSFNDVTTQEIKTELEAVIDIKPGSAVNSINLKSKGVVPVAILTTGDFDALSVDTESVIFAGAPPVRAQVEDADDDGDDDILFHFRTKDLSDLSFDSTEAILTGKTLDGTPFRGEDTVNIVPGK